MEYQTGALTQNHRPEDINTNSALGFTDVNSKQLTAQLNKLSNFLNNYFYEYREGRELEYQLLDGSLYRIDPWQNATTAALQHYFAMIDPPNEFFHAIGPEGFQATYIALFGEIEDHRGLYSRKFDSTEVYAAVQRG